MVIADLPCSGLGIIGPQAGYQIQRFNGRNRDFGCIAAKTGAVGNLAVREAGWSLVYSTCMVNRLENDENRAWF